MKRPTHEAARSLGLHPANLLLHLSSVGADFANVWPELDDVWIEEVRRHDWVRFGRPATNAAHPTSAGLPPRNLSKSAERIIAKLVRKKSWGGNTVGLDTLKNHWCQAIPEFDRALEELLQAELLSTEGLRGPYSLNQSRSGEIERIARAAEQIGTGER